MIAAKHYRVKAEKLASKFDHYQQLPYKQPKMLVPI